MSRPSADLREHSGLVTAVPFGVRRLPHRRMYPPSQDLTVPTGLSGCCAPLQMLTSTSDMGRQGSIQSLKDEAYALRADRA